MRGGWGWGGNSVGIFGRQVRGVSGIPRVSWAAGLRGGIRPGRTWHCNIIGRPIKFLSYLNKHLGNRPWTIPLDIWRRHGFIVELFRMVAIRCVCGPPEGQPRCTCIRRCAVLTLLAYYWPAVQPSLPGILRPSHLESLDCQVDLIVSWRIIASPSGHG